MGGFLFPDKLGILHMCSGVNLTMLSYLIVISSNE